MREFFGRWVLVGLFADVVLAVAGARLGPWGVWVLAALWVGFWNAALRPGILRLGMEGGGVYWALFLAISMLNGLLFWASSAWLPGATLPGRREMFWTAVCVSGVSFLLSSRFQSRDGRWHWISYHGAILRKGASR